MDGAFLPAEVNAHDAAIHALRLGSGPNGFAASAADAHYRSIWARDAAITTLGAVASGEPDLMRTGIRSLLTLASCSRPNGQIPNTVWTRDTGLYRDWHESGAVDVNAWFAIATAYVLPDCTASEAETLLSAASGAIRWLRDRDLNGMGVLWVPPAGDWMDSSLHRSGRTLLANALYVWALRLFETVAKDHALDLGHGLDAESTAAALRALLWPAPDLDPATLLFEVPEPVRTGWPHPVLATTLRRAHNPDRRWFGATLDAGRLRENLDVLGNCIAIIADVATSSQRDLILDALEELSVSEPFATRTLDAPVDPDDWSGLVNPAVEAAQDPRWRCPRHSYHNGGAWPYVGGFHAWALRLAGRLESANRVTAAIDKTNVVDGSWTFPEWVTGDTGVPSTTRMQLWSAAARLYAAAPIADMSRPGSRQ